MKLKLILLISFPLMAMDPPRFFAVKVISGPEEDTRDPMSYAPTPNYDENTPELIKAAITGRTSDMAKLLEEGADPNLVDSHGQMGLHIVAASRLFRGRNNTRALEILLNYGANIHAKDKLARTPLHWAARRGFHRAVKLMLDKGADATRVDYKGDTPLHLAVKSGCKKTIKMLSDYGLNAKGEYGRTPLHLAAQYGDHLTVKLFLGKGADATKKDSDDKVPLHCAVESGDEISVKMLSGHGTHTKNMKDKWTPLTYAVVQEAVSLVKILLEAGAYPGCKDRREMTPLHHLALKKDGDPKKQKEIMALLLRKGLSVDVLDGQSRTSLYCAVLCGNIAVVRYLLAHKASVKILTVDNRTPLHAACKRDEEMSPGAYRRHRGVVRLLIRENVPLDVVEFEGNTALHYAAKASRAAEDSWNDIVRQLVRAGARSDIEGPNKKKAADYPVVTDALVTFALHQELGTVISGGWTDLHEVAKQGDLSKVEPLLEKEIDLDQQDSDKGETPLHVASYYGYWEIIKALREAGASPEEVTYEGEMPHHYACKQGHAAAVECLLYGYEDLADEFTESRQTGLHLAAAGGHTEVVALLLTLGVFVDFGDDKIRTALHYAALGGHLETVEVLVTVELTFDAEDIDGNTACDLARDAGHNEIVTLLQETQKQSAEGTLIIAENDSDEKVFMKAARKGNLKKIQEYIEQDEAWLTYQDKKNKMTALHLCILSPMDSSLRLALVKYLVEKGADVTVQEEFGMTALHLCILSPMNSSLRLTLVEYLVEKGAGVTVQDKHGRTALHLCIQHAAHSILRLALVNYLVEKGVGVTVQDEYGMTALHQCLVSPMNSILRLALVKYLVKEGAPTNVQDNNGCTPLYYAARSGYETIVVILYNGGASVGLPNGEGISPLQAAAHAGHLSVVTRLIELGATSYALNDAVIGGHLPVVNYLFTRPVPFEPKEVARLLHAATKGQHHEVLAFLCTKYHQIGILKEALVFRDKYGNALTHNANLPCLKVLVSYVPDLIQVGDALNRTTIHRAVIERKQECLEFLLQGNPNLGALDKEDKTALFYAVDGNFLEGVCLLLQAGAPKETANTGRQWTALHGAAWRGYTAIVRLLLENKAFVRARDASGATAMHLAASQGYIEVVQLLLDYSASHRVTDDHGWTPWHYAAALGHAEVVTLLTQQKTSSSKTPRSPRRTTRWTPLHGACWYGHPEAARILLDNDASVNALTEDGVSPLDCALDQWNKDVIIMLLSEGARVSPVLEESPLYRALQRGDCETACGVIDACLTCSEDTQYHQLRKAIIEGNLELVTNLLSYAKTKNSTTLFARSLFQGFSRPNSPASSPLVVRKRSSSFGQPRSRANSRGELIELTQTDDQKRTLMHWAAYKGGTDCIQKLHAKDDSLHKYKDRYGCTPLICAVLAGKEASCVCLLGFGPEFTSDCLGRSALHYAAMRGLSELVTVLLQKEPSLRDRTDNQGRTALHWAALLGHEGVVKTLLEQGAQKDLKDEEGNTALQLAQSNGLEEVVLLLKD